MCRLGAVGSKPDVEPHAPLVQRLAQGVEVRRVGDQAAPLEVVEEGGVDGHAGAFRVVLSGPSLPHARCGRPPGSDVRA